MARILMIDDEPLILKPLALNLTARGHELALATTGAEGLKIAAEGHPDVILLDLGLPDIDGVDVVTRLRTWTTVPIIILSVRDAEREKVAALDAGADDYVTKPFGMDELMARLRASLRRIREPDEDAVVRTEHFSVDLAAARVLGADGNEIHLTPTEWKIVELLVRNPGRLVAQRTVLKEVWGPAYERETNYLRVYLAQVRRKLEPDPARPRYFITEAGLGYRFEPGNVVTD
jgi:two-component system KDP operon response regulator KdpE